MLVNLIRLDALTQVEVRRLDALTQVEVRASHLDALTQVEVRASHRVVRATSHPAVASHILPVAQASLLAHLFLEASHRLPAAAASRILLVDQVSHRRPPLLPAVVASRIRPVVQVSRP